MRTTRITERSTIMFNLRSMMGRRHGAWIAALGAVMAAMTGGHAIAAADDPYPKMAPVSHI